MTKLEARAVTPLANRFRPRGGSRINPADLLTAAEMQEECPVLRVDGLEVPVTAEMAAAAHDLLVRSQGY